MITLSFSKSILEKLQDNLLIALRLSNIRLYRLANALLWYAEGVGIKDIARRMGVHIKTIINWLTTFMHKGMAWLTGQHYQGRGRKEKLTKTQQAQLVELIKDGPEANGFHCGIGNSAMIAEVIWLKFEVRYNLNLSVQLVEKAGLQLPEGAFYQ